MEVPKEHFQSEWDRIFGKKDIKDRVLKKNKE